MNSHVSTPFLSSSFEVVWLALLILAGALALAALVRWGRRAASFFDVLWLPVIICIPIIGPMAFIWSTSTRSAGTGQGHTGSKH